MKLFVFLACLSLASAVSVQYTDCGSVSGTISNVDITPCDDPTFCALIKGQSSTVSVTFTANTDLTWLNATAIGIISNIPEPFPLPNANGCSGSGLTCPVKSGSTVTYVQSIPILTIYPELVVIIRYELHDQNGKDAFCFMIPTRITS